MRTVQLTKAMIDDVAKQISHQQIGLVVHQPETWAIASNCFRNVARKVREAGGRAQYGWTFHHRLAEKLPGQPLYFYVIHHSVWVTPTGHLIDVTPYPDARHEPIKSGDSPIFLLDDQAEPITAGGQPAPGPMRYFAMESTPGLAEYVAELNENERKACEEMHRLAATAEVTKGKRRSL